MLERWHADFGEEHGRVYARLAAAYSEPHRAYHTLSHVRAVLEVVDDALGPRRGLRSGGKRE